VRFVEARTGTQVDTLPINRPQHSHTYPGFVLAILSMPVDNTHKSAIVTSDRAASDGQWRPAAANAS